MGQTSSVVISRPSPSGPGLVNAQEPRSYPGARLGLAQLLPQSPHLSNGILVPTPIATVGADGARQVKRPGNLPQPIQASGGISLPGEASPSCSPALSPGKGRSGSTPGTQGEGRARLSIALPSVLSFWSPLAAPLCSPPPVSFQSPPPQPCPTFLQTHCCWHCLLRCPPGLGVGGRPSSLCPFYLSSQCTCPGCPSQTLNTPGGGGVICAQGQEGQERDSAVLGGKVQSPETMIDSSIMPAPGGQTRSLERWRFLAGESATWPMTCCLT